MAFTYVLTTNIGKVRLLLPAFLLRQTLLHLTSLFLRQME